MSGIAVIWNRNARPVDRAQIVRMTQLMEHRGPDGARHWVQGPLAIGHRALNTTPESAFEAQPVLDEAAGLCLTFDGRIDNREELKSQLEGNRPGVVETDADLVLAAYRKWGETCPEHLLGDFAFALWDEPRKRLFCARDHLGMRPFFYAAVGDTFVCASEIRALFAVPSLKMEPNLAIVTARLLGKSVEFEDTLYKGVSRLPLAHCLTVTRDTVQVRRYWDIDPAREIRYRTEEEYADHFRELFFAAVECRLRSSGPIASMLSGGLDSSSIVCAAQGIRREKKITQPSFESFSLVFEHLVSCDERPFIDEVVRYSGVKANFYVGDRDPSEAAIARYKLYPGLPYSPQAMVLGSMFARIKEGKFKVLLDGTGGDQLAGTGFHHLTLLMRGGRWLSLLGQLGGFASIYRMSRRRLFLDTCLKPLVPARVKAIYRRAKKGARSGKADLILVRDDTLRWTGAQGRMDEAPALPAFRNMVQSEMYGAIFTGWGPTVLADAYELLISYLGVELRQPFRDKRLVEFAMALPPPQLWRGGWSRIAFRNAMKGVLPEKVARRWGKARFSPQYDAVLAGSQAQEVRRLMEHSVLVRLGLVDPEALRGIVARYQNAPELNSSLQIADWVALEIECREMLKEPIFSTNSGV